MTNRKTIKRRKPSVYPGYTAKQTCEVCNGTSNLIVHHKDCSRRLGIKNMNNEPDNLMTLCEKCHGLEHSKIRGIYQRRQLLNKIDNEINLWLLDLSIQYGVSIKTIHRKMLLDVKNSGNFKYE